MIAVEEFPVDMHDIGYGTVSYTISDALLPHLLAKGRLAENEI